MKSSIKNGLKVFILNLPFFKKLSLYFTRDIPRIFIFINLAIVESKEKLIRMPLNGSWRQ